MKYNKPYRIDIDTHSEVVKRLESLRMVMMEYRCQRNMLLALLKRSQEYLLLSDEHVCYMGKSCSLCELIDNNKQAIASVEGGEG